MNVYIERNQFQQKVNKMKSEVATLKVFNPFSGEDEDLICTLSLHFVRGSLAIANIDKVVSEQGDNIIDWLNEEKIEELEREYVEKYHG